MDVSKECAVKAKYNTFYENSNSYTKLSFFVKKSTQKETNGKEFFLTYFTLNFFYLAFCFHLKTPINSMISLFYLIIYLRYLEGQTELWKEIQKSCKGVPTDFFFSVCHSRTC